VSKLALQGALESVAIGVQLLAPAGERSKVTRAAGEPLVVAVRVTVPDRLAPGSSSTTIGAVESTDTVTGELIATFPAASVATARRS